MNKKSHGGNDVRLNSIRQHFQQPMTEERAREILGEYTDGDLLSGTPMKLIIWNTNNIIELNGDFVPDELEAIAWWMRNKGKNKD